MTVIVSKPAVNLREKLAELDKPTGIAGEAMLRAETPQEQFNLIGAGRRNWIINGDFQVSQRGDFTTASSASDLGYSVDRFKNFVKIVTADVLHTKAATVNGEIKNTLKMTATSTASGRFGFRQYIESGSNGKTVLAGKTATVSVWMRSNHADAGFYFYDYGNSGYFYRVKHSGSGEWEKLTLTFPIATGNVTSNYYGYELNFTIQSNSNGTVSVTSGDYVEIAEPQFELGKVATPFEHRSYGEELALCQRYYEKWSGSKAMHPQYSSEAAGAYAAARELWNDFKVEKRANPSVTVTGTHSPSAVNASIYGLGAQASEASSTASVRISAWTADAEL